MKKIHRFVITGGPCGGKSTALNILKKVFTDYGFKVFIIPEIATEIVTLGLSFKEVSVNDFQNLLIERTLQTEAFTDKIVNSFDFNGKDIIIFYDRGLLDNKEYMPYDDFIKALTKHNITEQEATDKYDAVFHLVTAAKGAEKYYTLENNDVRHETPEEAKKLDDDTIAAWSTHKNLRIIDNSTSFDEKINRLIKEIMNFIEK